ncbi:MAG TPA: DUF2975 domain-containing protein [Kineosporiaceae bacterium]|nr:DUF2975 domain-containing protein [Kineosporiaceae bacterium]
MSRVVIILLRAAIAGAILFGLFGAAVVIPTTAADEVDRFPPYAPLQVPYTILAVLALLSVLVALGAVLALLSMVDEDAIFTDRAFVWVNIIIGCIAFSALLSAGATVHLLVADIPTPDDGMDVVSAILGTGACAALGGAFVLLMLVMRQLLHKAVGLHSELAEVV